MAGLPRLTRLDLSCCKQVRDLSPLAGLKQLVELRLWGCEQVSDLGPLAELMQLRRLFMSLCRQVSDLSPLAGLKITWRWVKTSVGGFVHLQIGVDSKVLLACSWERSLHDFEPIHPLFQRRTQPELRCIQHSVA